MKQLVYSAVLLLTFFAGTSGTSTPCIGCKSIMPRDYGDSILNLQNQYVAMEATAYRCASQCDSLVRIQNQLAQK